MSRCTVGTLAHGCADRYTAEHVKRMPKPSSVMCPAQRLKRRVYSRVLGSAGVGNRERERGRWLSQLLDPSLDLALRARLRRFKNPSRDFCRAIGDRVSDGCPWQRTPRQEFAARPAQRLKRRSGSGAWVARGGRTRRPRRRLGEETLATPARAIGDRAGEGFGVARK